MGNKEIAIYAITVTFTVSIILNIVCFATFLPMPHPDNMRDFNSMLELKTFLAISTVNQHEYTETYQCVNFVKDLVEEARQCGYRVWGLSDREGKHIMCCTSIGDILYAIEPQNDEIKYAIGIR